MKRIKGLFILGVIAFMLLAVTGCGKTTVKLDKYITITAKGYDSMGTASYMFDYDAYKKDYSGKVKTSKNGDESNGWGLIAGEPSHELLLDFCVSQRLDKTQGLSNGDVVTLKWTCEDEMAEEYFNVKLEHSDITYTVQGLQEVGKFNPFDYVTVTFSGTSPNGSVTITPNYNQPEMQFISFSANKKSGLKEGDSVAVVAAISGSTDSFVEKFGAVLGKTEKSYTVDGLARYVSDISDIPEEILNKMDNQLRDDFDAHVANHWESYENVDDFALVGNYMVTLKDGMQSSPDNYLYYVYKVTYSNSDVQNFEYYWYGYYTDISVLADGSCSVDLSGYTVSEASSSWGFTSGDYLHVEGSTCFVAGYPDLDTFLSKQIISKIDKYEFKQINR